MILLQKHLLYFVRAAAGHPGEQSRGGRKMQGRQWKAAGIEIVYRQIAVRLKNDRARIGFDRSRVNPIRKPFLLRTV
jgi:hypothetical protein